MECLRGVASELSNVDADLSFYDQQYQYWKKRKSASDEVISFVKQFAGVAYYWFFVSFAVPVFCVVIIMFYLSPALLIVYSGQFAFRRKVGLLAANFIIGWTVVGWLLLAFYAAIITFRTNSIK